MSVGGIQSEGSTCFSEAAPSGPEDSWNAAVSLKGNQDLDQGTWTKTITKPPKLIYKDLPMLHFCMSQIFGYERNCKVVNMHVSGDVVVIIFSVLNYH